MVDERHADVRAVDAWHTGSQAKKTAYELRLILHNGLLCESAPECETGGITVRTDIHNTSCAC